MDLELEEIKKYVGIRNFLKGENFDGDIERYGVENRSGITTYSFSVESESYYDTYYDVTIQEKNNEIHYSDCDCLQFNVTGMCKHVAACLIMFRDEIFKMNQEERKIYISQKILKEFYHPISKERHVKKQIHIGLDLIFSSNEDSVNYTFKIGTDKMYNLSNRLTTFLDVYKKDKGEINFGKKLVYNPDYYFLSKEDEKIIQYLDNKNNNQPYYYTNYRYSQSSVEDFIKFSSLIANKEIFIIRHGTINEIKEGNPIQLELKKEQDHFKLYPLKDNVEFISYDCRLVKKDKTLFIIPPKFARILFLMKNNKLDELDFLESDLPHFKDGILPLVKNNVLLDSTVGNDIVIGTKPIVKLFFDIKENIVICKLKLNYQDQEIDYFDESKTIIRDIDEENEVLQNLIKIGFSVEGKKIYTDDMDVIAYLIEEGFDKLTKDYEVYTSENLKKTKIIRNNHIYSSFSIGEDNIMSYDFDLGDISKGEITDLLDTMEQKKKYFRLKNGDLLDLTNNEDLKQFDQLVQMMNLSKKDIQNGKGTIPKYRAIYLDSLKKEKYNIIKTDNLFDQLINQFNSYKDIPITLSKKDKSILRDYQEVGVKWLYNIYKCGFGGILADEMGLGKSIQLIYLIKEIVKEKKDALFLIVAPTSLVYNWKNEFDKFGQGLTYKVFAENRTIRKQELEHIEGIQVLITTYGLVRQDKEQYDSLNFELIAIDEAQTIKNSNAQMTKVVKSLKATTKIALTGTPLENSVMELWSIFDYVMPGYLADKSLFHQKYNIKDVTKEDLKNLDSLKEQIKPFILRRKKTDVVKELPPKIENNISIDLNKEQKKIYVATLKKTREEMDKILRTEGFQKGSFKILQLLTKLRQICIDPSIVYDNYKGGSAKIDNLIEIVKGTIQNDHKILLFTSFKTALNIVKKEFEKNNITSYVIEGSTSAKKRMELVEKFNHDDTNVFLIMLKAGGTGLNLTSADVVIHLDLWWNPQVENQATDRTHRIGQTKTVEVIKLVCKGTIEERILELQNKKKLLSDALIEGKERDQNLISKLTEQDIKKLLTMDNEDDE